MWTIGTSSPAAIQAPGKAEVRAVQPSFMPSTSV